MPLTTPINDDNAFTSMSSAASGLLNVGSSVMVTCSAGSIVVSVYPTPACEGSPPAASKLTFPVGGGCVALNSATNWPNAPPVANSAYATYISGWCATPSPGPATGATWAGGGFTPTATSTPYRLTWNPAAFPYASDAAPPPRAALTLAAAAALALAVALLR